MTYTEVAKISSESNPDKEYTIKKDESGKLSCSCPAWRYMNSKNSTGERIRFCKHLKEYWQRILK